MAFWDDRLSATEVRQLREQHSGLSGFGARPSLHPAWQRAAEGAAALAERRAGRSGGVWRPAGPLSLHLPPGSGLD